MNNSNSYQAIYAQGQAPAGFDPTAESLEWEEESEHGRVLFRATFSPRSQAAYVSYTTWKWVLGSLVCILFYGIGLFMLFYTPVIRHIARRDIQTRRLFITSEGVVYKTRPPACCPSCGVNKKEKHCMLPLVTDVVLSQSWLEAKWGLWSVKIENAGQGGSPGGGNGSGYDMSVAGLDDPKLFKRILLMAATAKRSGMAVNEDMIGTAIRDGNSAALQSQGDGGRQLQQVPGGMPSTESPQALGRLDDINNVLHRIADLLAGGARDHANGGDGGDGHEIATEV